MICELRLVIYTGKMNTSETHKALLVFGHEQWQGFPDDVFVVGD